MDSTFGEVISTYTRAQAIEDGELADVSSTAREAGIKYPVAMTRAVWMKYVEVPKDVEGQDEAGRLWDVLWMFKIAARRGNGGSVLDFSLLVRNNNIRPEPVDLKAICGPGDTPEPVITIMLPEED